MKAAPILSIAKVLVRSKKIKLVLVGAQFGYMGYKYLKNRKRKTAAKSLKKKSIS